MRVALPVNRHLQVFSMHSYRFMVFLLCVCFILMVIQHVTGKSKTNCSKIICNGDNGELHLRISDLDNACSWTIKNKNSIVIGSSTHSIWDHIKFELSFYSTNGKKKTNIYDQFFNSTFSVKQINITFHKDTNSELNNSTGAIITFNYCSPNSTSEVGKILRQTINKTDEIWNKNETLDSKPITPSFELHSTLQADANHEVCTQYCSDFVQWRFEDTTLSKHGNNNMQSGEVLIVEFAKENFETSAHINCRCYNEFQLDDEIERIERLIPESSQPLFVSSLDEDFSKEKDWSIKLKPGRKLFIDLYATRLPRNFLLRLLASQLSCRSKRTSPGQKMVLAANCQNSSLTRLQIGCTLVYSCQDGYLPQTETLTDSYVCTATGLKHHSNAASGNEMTCRSGCLNNTKPYVWRDLNGTLLSPDFPKSFKILPKCQYDVETSLQHLIHLHFLQFKDSTFQMQILEVVNKELKTINVTQHLLEEWQHVYKSNCNRLTLRLVPRQIKSNDVDKHENMFHLNYVAKSVACILQIPSPSTLASGRLVVTDIPSSDLEKLESAVYMNGTKLAYSCLQEQAFSVLFWPSQANFSFQLESGSSVCLFNQDVAEWKPSLPGCRRTCGGEFLLSNGPPRLLLLPDEQPAFSFNAKCTWQFRTSSSEHIIRLSRLANYAPMDLTVHSPGYPNTNLKATDCQIQPDLVSALSFMDHESGTKSENRTLCRLKPIFKQFKSSVSVTWEQTEKIHDRTTLLQIEAVPNCDLSLVANSTDIVAENLLDQRYVEPGSTVHFTCRHKGLQIAKQQRIAKCVDFIEGSSISVATLQPPGQRECNLYCPNEAAEEILLEAERLKPVYLYIFIQTSNIKICSWIMRLDYQHYGIKISLTLRNSTQSLLVHFEVKNEPYQHDVRIHPNKKWHHEILASQVLAKFEMKPEYGNEYYIELMFHGIEHALTIPPVIKPSLTNITSESTISEERIIDGTKNNTLYIVLCCGSGLLFLIGLVCVAKYYKRLFHRSVLSCCERKINKRDISSIYSFEKSTTNRFSFHSIDLTQANPAQTDACATTQDSDIMLDVRCKLLTMLHPDSLPLHRMCGEWPTKYRAGAGTPVSMRSNHRCVHERDNISCNSLPYHQHETDTTWFKSESQNNMYC